MALTSLLVCRLTQMVLKVRVSGNAPASPTVMATLRNTAIGYHRPNGDTNIARATRRANRRPHDLITAVASDYPRTQ